MPRLIKLQPKVNPIITISPGPFGALPTPHKQRSNWTSLIVGGARPLYNPKPQLPALPGDVYTPLPQPDLPLSLPSPAYPKEAAFPPTFAPVDTAPSSKEPITSYPSSSIIILLFAI